jgi:hypothetical protein
MSILILAGFAVKNLFGNHNSSHKFSKAFSKNLSELFKKMTFLDGFSHFYDFGIPVMVTGPGSLFGIFI